MSKRILLTGMLAALAFSTSARCAVIVTALPSPLDIHDDFFGRFDPVDIDNDGTIDYTFVSTFAGVGFQTSDLNRAVIRLDPPPNIGGPPVSLGIGYIIGASLQDYLWDDSDMSIVQVLSTGSASEFNGRGAIGLEFRAHDGIHYAYFDISAGPGFAGITLYGWAYETQSGVPIVVGIIPEPHIYILVFLGSVIGITRHTRK